MSIGEKEDTHRSPEMLVRQSCGNKPEPGALYPRLIEASGRPPEDRVDRGAIQKCWRLSSTRDTSTDSQKASRQYARHNQNQPTSNGMILQEKGSASQNNGARWMT